MSTEAILSPSLAYDAEPPGAPTLADSEIQSGDQRLLITVTNPPSSALTIDHYVAYAIRADQVPAGLGNTDPLPSGNLRRGGRPDALTTGNTSSTGTASAVVGSSGSSGTPSTGATASTGTPASTGSTGTPSTGTASTGTPASTGSTGTPGSTGSSGTLGSTGALGSSANSTGSSSFSTASSGSSGSSGSSSSAVSTTGGTGVNASNGSVNAATSNTSGTSGTTSEDDGGTSGTTSSTTGSTVSAGYPCFNALGLSNVYVFSSTFPSGAANGQVPAVGDAPLTDSIEYGVQIQAVDTAGNVSGCSNVAFGTPYLINDFWREYVGDGGDGASGCTSIPGEGLLALVGLLSVATRTRRRRNRKARS